MYAVVGCNECSSLWILEDPDSAETATCRRCGKRHRVGKLRRFFESADRDEARQARARMLADKQGELDAFEQLGSVGEQERRVADAGVDDREFLEASGLDADDVERAGDVGSGRAKTRDERVREAIRAADPASEEEIVTEASKRDVPESVARDILEGFARRGEVTESRGEYRLL